jgi:hypothetical protein
MTPVGGQLERCWMILLHVRAGGVPGTKSGSLIFKRNQAGRPTAEKEAHWKK